MRTEPAKTAASVWRMSWRDWMRSYVLAGRIAASIIQARPDGRLPAAYGLTRVQRASQHGHDRSERIGNVVITVPLECAGTDARTGERPRNEPAIEDPFGLPRLDCRR